MSNARTWSNAKTLPKLPGWIDDLAGAGQWHRRRQRSAMVHACLVVFRAGHGILIFHLLYRDAAKRCCPALRT